MEKRKVSIFGVILGFLIIILGITMLIYLSTNWVGLIILSQPGEKLAFNWSFPPYYFLGYLFVIVGALVSTISTILIPEENSKSNSRALKVLS